MSGVRSAFGRREATRSQRFACTQLLMIGLHDVVGNLEFSAWALAFVVVYYSLASILVRRPGALRPIVPRYEPPPGASPAVAATLLEPGDLPLSIAAALVNMAAKRYIRIEQNGDLFSVIQLNNQGLPKLEPEEHILQRNLLDKYDFFDFDFSSPQLDDAVRAFPWALYNTGYISRHYGTSLLAWIVSAAAVFLALIQAQPSREWGRVLGYDLACTFACFILTVRTMRGPLDKLLCRLPGGAAPQRPWTGADRQPFLFLSGTVIGIALLSQLTSSATAILIAGFMAVNAIFFMPSRGRHPRAEKWPPSYVSTESSFRKWKQIRSVDETQVTRRLRSSMLRLPTPLRFTSTSDGENSL